MTKEEIKQQAESLINSIEGLYCDEIEFAIWHVQSKIDLLEKQNKSNYKDLQIKPLGSYSMGRLSVHRYLRGYLKKEINQQKEILKYLKEL